MKQGDRVLVIGGGGLVGRALIESLKARGYSDVLAPDSTTLNCLSSADTTRYFDEHRPNYVFHLAALVFGLKGNQNNQFLSLTQNTMINHNALVACAATGVKKTFFAGTVASYAFPYIRLPLDESDHLAGPPHAGEFGYASAKRHALNYLEIMKADFGLDYVYGMFTNMYGLGDRFDVQNGHVIPSLIRKAAIASETGGVFEVWGKPSTTRDYMYAADAAAAAVHLMETTSGVVNIASGETTTLDVVVSHIRESFPGLPDTTWQSDQPVGIPNRSVSTARLSATGFRCASTLQRGIQATCAWYKQNKKDIRL